jgi:hypothetical protein
MNNISDLLNSSSINVKNSIEFNELLTIYYEYNCITDLKYLKMRVSAGWVFPTSVRTANNQIDFGVLDTDIDFHDLLCNIKIQKFLDE